MVNGQPIVWNAEKGVWQLTGDLVVTGAISMFSSLSGFVPSTVTDAVLVDNETIIKVKDAQGNWVLRALGGGSGGTGGGLTAAEVNTLISNALKPYALSTSIPTDNKQLENGAGYITAAALNGFATEQYVTTRGYITSDALAGYATESWVTNKGYLTISSLLGYATEQWVGDNYLSSTNFTKANIKSTLGISDWALAATKPSYTAAEVGALATSGGTISGDLTLSSANAARVIRFDTSVGSSWLFVNSGEWYVTNIGWGAEYKLIHSNNIGSYNAGSATKLATPRTIWGQSFDGTADVSGTIKNVDVIRNARSNWIIGEASLDGEVHIGSASFAQARTLYNANGMLSLLANGTFRLLRREDTPPLMHSILTYEAAPYGLLTRINTDGSVSLQAQREANDAECFRLLLNPLGGNVAIGGTTADVKLHIWGDVKAGGATFSSNNSCNLILNSNAQSVTFATLQIDNVAKGYVGYSKDGVFLQNGTASWAYITVSDDGKFVTSCDAVIGGNLVATGAITMFSQLSMKNVIDYDGLSLAQLVHIRPARFTWKDNRDNRTHVGCIADYIQLILPEVVYETVNKELTVDYGSAAFYIGASLIKPVIDHEKRIAELEREVEYLREENRQLRAS